jgi:hypothetical protein
VAAQVAVVQVAAQVAAQVAVATNANINLVI